MRTRESPRTDELGPVIASYGWSFESRATAIVGGFAALAFGLGWVTWERAEYGSVSVGGAVVFVVAVSVGATAIWVGTSSLGGTPLVLHRNGLVSTIHPRASVCLYSSIGDIVEFRGRSERYHALFLNNGDVVRIERIRKLHVAVAQIRSQWNAIRVPLASEDGKSAR